MPRWGRCPVASADGWPWRPCSSPRPTCCCSTNRPDNAVVAITHDRWFLDAIATQTWEVDSGQVFAYEGGYAAYVLAKAERERMAGVIAERRDNLLRKELAWLRRGPPARTSKPKFGQRPHRRRAPGP